MSAPTLLSPNGYTSSTCGYCSPSGQRSSGSTSKKYGLVVPQMSSRDAIDRGWRRSGTYMYHPDMARTCCPQYTIRLDAGAYKPTKKHRQVVNRLNRYLSTGLKPGEAEQDRSGATGQPTSEVQDNGKVNGRSKGKGKERSKGEWDLMAELRAREEGYGETAGQPHRYTTELVPAKATQETFELYRRYQVAVHNDPASKVTKKGFERFLCDSPVMDSPIKYAKGTKVDRLPKTYGSYHLLYRIDGHLVGISVIDILPSCVSSVYFIWDPDWAWASLGKVSAIREIALARDIRAASVEDMQYVYMGYWIAGCGKMRYKSEYSPSYLLDPGTNEFHPLTPSLDKFLQGHPQGYYPFATFDTASPPVETSPIERDGSGSDGDEAMSDVESLDDFPSDPTPGFAIPSSYTDEEIADLLVLMKGRGGISNRPTIFPVSDLQFIDKAMAEMEIREMVAALGIDFIARKGINGSDLDRKGFLYFG